MAAERIEIDVSKALADIARLKGGLTDLKGQIGQVEKAGDAAFDEGFSLGMVDALNDLQKEYGELKRGADTLKSALRTATDPTLIKNYTQAVGKLEAGMSKLETAGKAAGVNLKQANKEAGTGKQVFEGLFGAISKATIILAAVAAVKQFATQALALADQTKKASLQFEAFLGSAEKAKEVIGTLQSFAGQKLLNAQEVFDAGKGLLAFGEEADNLVPVLSRVADISKATGKNFGELTTIYGKARAAGVLYAEDINQLVDAGIPIIGEFAKQMGVSTSEVKKLASEGKISFEELQLAFFNLTAEGGKFAGQAEAGATAGDKFNVAWTNALTTVGVALKPAWDFVLNSLTGILTSVTKLGESTGVVSFAENAFRAMAKITPAFALLEKITDKLSGKKGGSTINETADKDALAADRREYEAGLLERERLEKAAADKRKEGNKKKSGDAAKAEKERSQLVLAAMKDGQEKEIATENLKYSELVKQLKKYHIDTTEATEQHNLNIQEIELKYTLQRITDQQKLLDLRKAQAEFEAEQAKGNFEKQKKSLEDIKTIRESEIDLTEAEFENFIKVLEDGGAKKEEIAKLQFQFDQNIQAQRLKANLAFQKGLLDITAAGDATQITLIKNNIALLEEQLAGIGTGFGADAPKEPKGILDLLGIDLGLSDAQMRELEQGLNNIKSIFDDVAGAQLDAADAAIEAAEKNIGAAQSAVDEQKRLNEEGFANNLSDAERNLAAAKEQEQKAIAQKKAAQRQQQLIDTASQVSSLITASAKTLQIFNGPLLPIGIALVAAMFGAFLAAKARAAQAAKFKHGGEGRVDGNSIIVGASHDTGGVGIEAEGGEYFATDGKRFGIVNKRMTAKHFDLIQAINKDDKGRMRQALEALTSPNLRHDAALAAAGSGGAIAIIGGGEDRKTHKLLQKIHDKPTKTITVEGGYVVERNGNHTRRRRIRA